MELTPNDIRNFEFPGKVRGYDREAVDNFREQVALTLENLKQENLKLTMEVESVKTQLTGLKQFEDAIKNAAIDARRNADATIANAKKEAEEILAKACAEADHQTSDLGQQKTDLEAAVANISLLKRSYLSKLQGMIHSHLEWVQELTKVELPNQDFDAISVTPMLPPQQTARQGERLDVTASSEITTKSRETIASQPTRDRTSRTEEANAASRLVTVEQLSAQADQPHAEPTIDPELAAALNNYQHASTGERQVDPPKPGKQTARIEIPAEYQGKATQPELHVSTDRVKTDSFEHASINIDTPIPGTPIPAPQDPNSLASVLDNVVHKFEEEMDKAAKS
jgi:cell division initiation protein